jgi:hypothetical protein
VVGSFYYMLVDQHSNSDKKNFRENISYKSNQIKSNILLTNKLNYKYTYKGERIVWLIDRHNNTIVK